MARKKTSKVRVNVKASLSRRLREIRQELFGEHGGPELARRLNLPARTWYNYETGVTVPAEVLLGFIDQTGANPGWLLTGEGSRFRQSADDRLLSELTPVELIRLGLEELERSPGEIAIIAPENLPTHAASEFVAIGLYPLSEIGKPILDPARVEGHVLAYRHWLPNPTETIGTRLTDEAMHPTLSAGSIVAIDRSMTDPFELQGQIVAARPSDEPIVRWLDVSGADPRRIRRPQQAAHHRPGCVVLESIWPELSRTWVPCGLPVLLHSSRIYSGNWHASRFSGWAPRSR